MELSTEPNIKLAKRLNVAAWIITVLVLGLVVMMRRIKIDTAIDFSFLPAFHATLNAVTAVILIIALIQVKRRNLVAHQRLMILAVVTSVLFLLSYVAYHITTPETAYCIEGWTRPVYFTLLISHVILAAGIFPFILFTLIRAVTNQFDRHRKLARWVFPIWLYVAVSGPVLFLMLKPCYS